MWLLTGGVPWAGWCWGLVGFKLYGCVVWGLTYVCRLISMCSVSRDPRLVFPLPCDDVVDVFCEESHVSRASLSFLFVLVLVGLWQQCLPLKGSDLVDDQAHRIVMWGEELPQSLE